jgi:hypothetical protein
MEISMLDEKGIIAKKIGDLSENIKFIGHADAKKIDIIENELHVKLPESYIWSILRYSLLLMPGFIILGAGESTDPICLYRTRKYREFGLPQSYVVIEDEGDECLYCLETSRMNDGECPVVRWTKEGRIVIKDCYQNFYQFLNQRLDESKELIENI